MSAAEKAPPAGLRATESAERGEVAAQSAESDVELVARALYACWRGDGTQLPEAPTGLYERLVRQRWAGMAHNALAALAGRLLPPVVQTREEWGVAGIGGTFASLSSARSNREHNPASLRNRPISVRTITTFADRSQLIGAWRHVGE